MKLENIMQPITTYFQMDNTLKEVTESMLKTKHNTIPVIDEAGNLLGVFTRSSLYRMILDGASLDTEIGSYIIQEATVTPHDITLEQLQLRLQNSKVGETIILNQEGKVAGLLTKQSVVRALIELTSSLKNQANARICLQSRIGKHACRRLRQSIPGLILLREIPGMEETIQKVKRVTRVRSSVLIRGESGTGKELIAHAIHSSSNRSKGPFVTINCAAIPEPLLEAEFFGYEGGAFTGAERKGPNG